MKPWPLVAVLSVAGAIWVLGRRTTPDPHREALPLQQETLDHEPEHMHMEIDYGRCTSVLRLSGELLCEFDPTRPFKLWITHPAADDVVVRLDGQVIDGIAYSAKQQLGTGLHLEFPTTATRLVVDVPGASNSPWSLALRARSDAPPLSPGVEEAFESEALLMEEHLNEGNTSAGLAAMERAFGLAMRESRLSDAVDIVLVATHYLSQQVTDPAFVDALFERVEPIATQYPQGRADLNAYRGRVQWRYGRLDAAAESLRDASRVAMRLQDTTLVEESLLYGSVLSELGYHEAASRWGHQVLSLVRKQAHPCDVVSALRTVAWLNLVLRRQGRPHQDDPRALLEEALHLLTVQDVCHPLAKEGGTRLGLAEVALDEGDVEGARQLVSHLDFDGLTFDERLLARDLEVRTLLFSGASEATLLASLSWLRDDVLAGPGLPRSRWLLATRRGDVLAAVGAPGTLEAAATAYQEAEDHLDELMQWASFGVGRVTIGEEHRHSADRLVATLLSLGHVDRALCAAREAQARRVAAVVTSDGLPPDQRARLHQRVERYTELRHAISAIQQWGRHQPADHQTRAEQQAEIMLERLRRDLNAILAEIGRTAAPPACHDLRPTSSGELTLGVYPSNDEWLVFSQDEQGTLFNRLGPGDVRRFMELPVLEQLLSPDQARALKYAKQLRVLASNEAERVDFHLAPWQGEPVLSSLPVVFGAEVRFRTPDPWPDEPHAVLLGDPTRSLPGAQREIELVHEQLLHTGWANATIIEPKQAGLPFVEDALSGAHLAHIAAHADYDDALALYWPPYEGGTRGWASYIELLPPARLTAHDVLLLPRVPDVVVLKACKAGAIGHHQGGPSLALAFLTAGSAVVVAAPEPTNDLLEMELGRRLYQGSPPSAPSDVARMTQQAQWSMLAEGKAIGGYRVWVQ